MNKANLLKVADAIENGAVPNLGFNMSTHNSDYLPDKSFHKCGTTACIAGWTNILNNVEPELESQAAEYLGLSSSQLGCLFYGEPQGIPFADVTADMAVRTLRYAAEHDVVDWDAANPPAD